MPPKKNAVSSNATSEKSRDPVHILLTVLSHSAAISGTDWNAVAAEFGIGYSRNAPAKVKTVAEKHGYKYEAGKISKGDGSVNGMLTTPKSTPKSSPKSDKKKSEDSNEADSGSPSKKRKVASGPLVDQIKPEVKEEELPGNS